MLVIVLSAIERQWFLQKKLKNNLGKIEGKSDSRKESLLDHQVAETRFGKTFLEFQEGIINNQ